jgi:hypothetical protein
MEASGARLRPADSAELKELESTLRTRAEVLGRAASSDPDLIRQAGQAYCALGRFYADSLRNARSAIEAFRRASELDPRSTDAIRAARMLYTKARRYQKALRMLLAEQSRIVDPAERIELYRDEAVLRLKLQDLPGSSHALRLALALDPKNSAIVENLARSILERVNAGHEVDSAEREEAAGLFNALARSLWPKPRPIEGLEPSSPRSAPSTADNTPPPGRSLPQPTSLSADDWTGPDSDWPPESPATLDSEDLAAIAQLRTLSPSSAPPPAGPETGAPADPSDRAPTSTLLLPPPAEAEDVLVFELRSPSAKPPPVAELPLAPMEPPGVVKAGLEPSAPPRAMESQRPRGDALIGRLFEAVHTLEFLEDAQSGAEFVLRLAMETLEVQIGIVHLHDFNSRSFVIASAGGPKADALIELRCPETEPLLAQAMACDKPLLLAEAQGHPLTSRGRWALLDCARSILCAPVQQGGRFLAAIEVANPVDGSPFSADDLNAMSYVAERFARFLAARGIVFSTDDVSAAE